MTSSLAVVTRERKVATRWRRRRIGGGKSSARAAVAVTVPVSGRVRIQPAVANDRGFPGPSGELACAEVSEASGGAREGMSADPISHETQTANPRWGLSIATGKSIPATDLVAPVESDKRSAATAAVRTATRGRRMKALCSNSGNISSGNNIATMCAVSATAPAVPCKAQTPRKTTFIRTPAAGATGASARPCVTKETRPAGRSASHPFGRTVGHRIAAGRADRALLLGHIKPPSGPIQAKPADPTHPARIRRAVEHRFCTVGRNFCNTLPFIGYIPILGPRVASGIIGWSTSSEVRSKRQACRRLSPSEPRVAQAVLEHSPGKFCR